MNPWIFVIIGGLWALLRNRGASVTPPPGAAAGGVPAVTPPVTPSDPLPPIAPDIGTSGGGLIDPDDDGLPPAIGVPVAPNVEPAPWSMLVGSGGDYWPDVCKDSMLVWSHTGTRQVFFNGTPVNVAQPFMFTRACVSRDGFHVAIGRGHEDWAEVCCLESGKQVQLGPVHLNFSVACEANDDGTVTLIWVESANGATNRMQTRRVRVIPPQLTFAGPIEGPFDHPYTDGFMGCANGEPVYRVQTTRGNYGGVVLAGPPVQAGDWVVGEAQMAGWVKQLSVCKLDGSRAGTLYQGEAHNPTAVLGFDGLTWIACRTIRDGAFFARVPAPPALVTTGPIVIPPLAPIGRAIIGAYLYQGGLPPVLRDGSSVNCVMYDEYLRRLSDRAPIARMVDTEYNFSRRGMSLQQSVDEVQGEPLPRKFYLAWSDIPDGFLPMLRRGDIVSFPMFRNPGESLGSLESRGIAAADKVANAGLQFEIVAGFYTRLDTLSVQQVLECMPVWRRMCDRPGSVGLDIFGINRRDGTGTIDDPTVGYPVFFDAIRQFRTGGVPELSAAATGGDNPDGTIDYGDHVDWPVYNVAGVLRNDRAVLIDDVSRKMRIGTTLFPLLWMVRHDESRARANLQWARDRGVEYIRALGCVGGNSVWGDRECNPNWPDYDDVVRYTHAIADSIGIRIEWTLIGGTELLPMMADRRRFFERWINLSRGSEHVICHWEVANEIQNRGEAGERMTRDEARALAGLLRRNTPNLVAISSVAYDQLEYWYRNSAANLLTFHLDRDISGTGQMWRPIRQAWELQFELGKPDMPPAWSSNEPIGPKTSVNMDDDPVRIGISPAYAALSGCGAYVFHTGAGVFMGGAAGESRQREHNLYDIANADRILEFIRTSIGLLPGDIANWRRWNGHWPDNPISAERSAFDDGRLLRAITCSEGDQVVYLPLKIEADVPVRVLRNADLQIYDPSNGSVLEQFSINAGEFFTMRPQGARAGDGAYTQIIKGRWT